MKTIAVIQARMGSKRLPGKTLMPLLKHSLLGTVINSVRRNRFIDELIVVTSTNKEDDEIFEYCKINDIPVFRGHPENVLSRFIEVARELDDNDVIVRVTADNPLNNTEASFTLFNKHIEENNDYTFVEGLSHVVYEYINVGAIKRLALINDLSCLDNEHVTFYFRNNPSKFKIASLSPKELNLLPHIDKLLTIDSLDDYKRYKKIIEIFDVDDLVDFPKLYSWLLSENPAFNE